MHYPNNYNSIQMKNSWRSKTKAIFQPVEQMLGFYWKLHLID